LSLTCFSHCTIACTLADSKREWCVKIHQRREAFEKEVRVLQDAAASSDVQHRVPKVVFSDDKSLAVCVEPFAHASLADATFTPALFASACQGAAALLPWLHSRKWAYCDPSPLNVLVHGPLSGPRGTRLQQIALWNDFSDTCPLGETLKCFQGTHAYSSLDMSGLALQNEASHVYTPLDDAQAVFFTLLSFCWLDDHHDRLLPWARAASSAQTWALKLAYARGSPSYWESVQPAASSTLRALHRNIFDDCDANAAWQTLAAVSVGDEKTAVPVRLESVFVARSRFHSACDSHGYKSLVERSLCAVDDGMLACPRCFGEEQALACACTLCAAPKGLDEE
jgi:hypothetical protein